MQCEGCGGDIKGGIRLCPECLVIAREERRAHTIRAREQLANPAGVEVDAASKIAFTLYSNPILVVFLLVFAVLLVWLGLQLIPIRCPDRSMLAKGLVQSFFLSLAFVSGLVTAYTVVWLWCKMLFIDKFYALVSLFLPAMVYRFVIVHWEEARSTFFYSIGALLLFVPSLGILLYLKDVPAESIATSILLTLVNPFGLRTVPLCDLS